MKYKSSLLNEFESEHKSYANELSYLVKEFGENLCESVIKKHEHGFENILMFIKYRDVKIFEESMDLIGKDTYVFMLKEKPWRFGDYLLALEEAGVDLLKESMNLIGKDTYVSALERDPSGFGYYLLALKEAGIDALKESINLLGKDIHVLVFKENIWGFGEYLRSLKTGIDTLRKIVNTFGKDACAVGIEKYCHKFKILIYGIEDKPEVLKSISRKMKNPADDWVCYFLDSFALFRDNIGKQIEFDVFVINGKDYVLPYYKLDLANGKMIYGKKGIRFKPLLRDDNGKIRAIPKLHYSITRTCFIPELKIKGKRYRNIEVKGIGTVEGKPSKEFDRGFNEIPDPVGGFRKGKASYEYLMNLFLYLAGVNVPEPLALFEIDYKPFDYNKEGKLAVFFKKVKTPFRGGEYPEDEFKRIEFIGLIHSYPHGDNFNMANEILDLEGMKLAEFGKPEAYMDKKFLRVAAEALKRCKRVNLEKREISMERDTIDSVVENLQRIYDEVSSYGLRVIPKELSYKVAELEFNLSGKGRVFSGRYKNCLVDPRVIVAEAAENLLRFKRDKKLENILSRFRNDLKETERVMKRYVNDLEKRFGIKRI